MEATYNINDIVNQIDSQMDDSRVSKARKSENSPEIVKLSALYVFMDKIFG